jgi:hypothetical protein
MAYGTVNADVIGTSVAGSNLGAGNASIMKNRIINGAMVIDQRNAGASVTPTVDATYTLDRFGLTFSQASKFSVQQNAGSVTSPVGFTNYLGATVVSAVSIGASDYFGLFQFVEGYNSADLQWGTANAKTVTLSFQVYSSLTGTFGGSLQNSAQNRSYPFTYSVPVANTWTTISITIAGDTSGTWVGATNGIGIRVRFGLGVGTTVSGTAGAWAGANYFSATGATSVVGTSGATFYITGVQLEVGSSATGFEYRQYTNELALCQRYYEKIGFGDANSRYPTVWGYVGGAGATVYMSVSFVVSKRAIATLVKGTDAVTNGTTSADGTTYNGFRYFISGSAAGQAGATFSTDGITASAEL